MQDFRVLDINLPNTSKALQRKDMQNTCKNHPQSTTKTKQTWIHCLEDAASGAQKTAAGIPWDYKHVDFEEQLRELKDTLKRIPPQQRTNEDWKSVIGWAHAEAAGQDAGLELLVEWIGGAIPEAELEAVYRGFDREAVDQMRFEWIYDRIHTGSDATFEEYLAEGNPIRLPAVPSKLVSG